MKNSSEKSILINATPDHLWAVLTQSEYTKIYMFNCGVTSDWTVGSSIIWEGNFQGYDAYQKGEILAIDPNKSLKYTTFDPNFGLEDIPSNYIHITYVLTPQDKGVTLTITNETMDGNPERMKHINEGWDMVILGIKAAAEKG